MVTGWGEVPGHPGLITAVLQQVRDGLIHSHPRDQDQGDQLPSPASLADYILPPQAWVKYIREEFSNIAFKAST